MRTSVKMLVAVLAWIFQPKCEVIRQRECATAGRTARFGSALMLALASLCPLQVLLAQYPTPNLTGSSYTTGPFARHTSPLLVGQCTWFARGRIVEAGVISAATLSSKGIFLGNATTWPNDAIAAGYSTGSQPRQGALAVWTSGLGHVAFVESVVGGVAQFSECNATPTSTSPNTIVVCRDDLDAGGWKVRLRSGPSTSASPVGYLPKFNVFSVVGGPTSGDGYSWYHIQGGGYDGWAALLDIDTGNAATANFSWDFTRIKLTPSSTSIAMSGSPSTYIYLSSSPAPSITSVSPNPVTGSNSRQTITIYGLNFVNKPTLTLTWTGQPGYTVPDAQVTFVSSTQVQMSITTTTSPDTWTVKVTNPDGQASSPATFTVVAPTPAPSITSVSPNPVTGSNSRQTITIYGLNFVNKPTLTLTWTGQPGYTVPDAQVTFVSSTQVQLSITTTTSPDTWTAKVTNPDGQASSPATFTVVAPAPAPSITSVSPNPVTGSNSRQTITINGANFVNKPTLTLTWTGQPGYTVPDAQVTFVSSSQVQMSITTTTAPDTWTVKVTNPDGQASSPATFTVVAPTPAPSITSVSPNPVTGSNSRQTITINGANFVNKPTLTLTWTGQPGYTVPDAQVTFVSGSQVQMSITTTTAPDTWTVKVTNPDGQASSPATFTVVAPTPAPSITSVSPNPVTGSNSRQTITINGANFVNKPTLTLTWTGQPGYTVPDAQVTFVSGSQVQMSITTTTAPDTWTVKVTNPDGQASSPATFTVVAPTPAPSTTSVSPNPVTGSNSRQTITINGANFVNKPTLTLTWTGQPGYTVPDAQVTFVSGSQVPMSITTTTAPDTWTVKVTNPDGQASSPATFTVVAPTPAPSITSVSPNPVTGSNSRQTITINGANFVNKPTLTLTWTGQPGYTVPDAQVTFVSGSQVQMSITTTTAPDTWTVEVTNPDGQASSPATFTVQSPVTIPGEPQALGVSWIPSPNFDSRPANQLINSIVLHVTEGSYEAALAELTDASVPIQQRVSAHYIIKSTGEIVQLVDLAARAWHATYYNDRSIGIEMVGFADQASTWNPQNLAALENLVAYLVTKYNLQCTHPAGDASTYPNCLFTENGLIGHSQIQPGCNGYALKTDPGPYFPWATFVQDVQGKVGVRPVLTGVGGGPLAPPSNGQIQLQISAPSQRTTIIQWSGDLVHWTDIGSVTGTAVFTDPNAGMRPIGFYRPKP